jgi:hypothetical protein
VSGGAIILPIVLIFCMSMWRCDESQDQVSSTARKR